MGNYKVRHKLLVPGDVFNVYTETLEQADHTRFVLDEYDSFLRNTGNREDDSNISTIMELNEHGEWEEIDDIDIASRLDRL